MKVEVGVCKVSINLPNSHKLVELEEKNRIGA